MEHFLAWLRRFPGEQVPYFWIFLFPTIMAVDLANHPQVGDHAELVWVYLILATIFMVALIDAGYEFFFVQRLGGPNHFSLRAIPFHVVNIGVSVLLGVQIAGFLMSPLLPPEALGYAKYVWGLVSLVGAPMCVVGITAYERYQEMRTRELEAQRAALAAQVQALQGRIQPHFLFNCLNTVASLIEEDPKRAEAAVVKLSDLFRYTLDASKKRFVPLAEELDTVEGFLDLEMLRHPERLKVAMQVEVGTGEIPVPPLLLQPIVENAVHHGIAPRRGGGRLEVQVRRDAGVLRVSVEDDGPGPGGSGHRGAGTGLRDLRERLALLYGEAATLEVGKGSLGGYRVDLRLPLRTGDVQKEPPE